MTSTERALQFCSMFEAELLVQLMLSHWRHPLADDAEFLSDLLDKTAEALNVAHGGVKLLADVPTDAMNFVAAVWYVEWAGVESGSGGLNPQEARLRREWLQAVRQSLPSCFCDPDDLA